MQRNNLTGEQFGRLTVLGFAGKDKKRNSKWSCKCACGIERVIIGYSLLSGATISCGCAVKRQRVWNKFLTKENLIEQHLNQKKSIRQIAREVGCSGPCVKSYMSEFGIASNPTHYDILGQKFGRLTVIEFLGTKPYPGSKTTRSFWKVQCDCGTIKETNGHSLVHGKTLSCGCWNREKSWRGYGSLSMSYWRRVIDGAKKRALTFDLEIKQGWELYLKQDKKCALTGLEIQIIRNYSVQGNKQSASLDRIDSNKGYTIDNVQWVHLVVNRMKWDSQQDEFIEWCRRIADYNPNAHTTVAATQAELVVEQSKFPLGQRT